MQTRKRHKEHRTRALAGHGYGAYSRIHTTGASSASRTTRASSTRHACTLRPIVHSSSRASRRYAQRRQRPPNRKSRRPAGQGHNDRSSQCHDESGSNEVQDSGCWQHALASGLPRRCGAIHRKVPEGRYSHSGCSPPIGHLQSTGNAGHAAMHKESGERTMCPRAPRRNSRR